MNATSKLPSQPSGEGEALLYARMGDGGGLRDADWASAGTVRAGGLPAARLQWLHRWMPATRACAAGLAFQPLDGNPRHGVLALYLDGQAEAQGVLEILERQGHWLVMPDRARARQLLRPPPVALRCGVAGTPDGRFVFFNTLQEGAVVTLVARRKDAGPTFHEPSSMAPQ